MGNTSALLGLGMIVLLGPLGIPSSAQASSLSFTGILASAETDFEQGFSLSAPSTLTIQTWGFGGGTNAAGTVIPAGGFASLLVIGLGWMSFVRQRNRSLRKSSAPAPR
jgi:hypothetical protein